jgi:hypothetical protein
MSDGIDHEVSKRKRNDLGMHFKMRLGLSEIPKFLSTLSFDLTEVTVKESLYSSVDNFIGGVHLYGF